MKRYGRTLDIEKEYPCIVLTTDHWDDYREAETLFHSCFYLNSREYTNLGDVKIMSTKSTVTRNVIEKSFTQLDDSYCSLGQDVSYYMHIRDEIDKSLHQEIFDGLRDAAMLKDVSNKFRNKNIFHVSLLRFSQAEKAFKEAKDIMLKREVNKQIKFKFSCQIPSATEKHIVNLDFRENKNPYECGLPHRINAFIGKNATGKTKVLTELASKLSGATNSNGKEYFKPERPSFSKIIALSYSAFDELYKPFNNTDKGSEYEGEKSRSDENVMFSYVYCGLRNKKGVLSLEEIEDNFYTSFSKLESEGRGDQWYKIMSNVFEKEHIELVEKLRINRNEGKKSERLTTYLSSGQNILLTTMTEVIANIENDSLLLFDEPEIHLHPNAIANFMRMFYVILEEFDSYAIISTHSPLIIQELPSKYVNVFTRNNNTPNVEPLQTECFGENISTITNDIFDVREHESNYKTWFRKMSESYSKEDIITAFNDELSFNALTFLNSLYKNKKDKED